MKQSFVGACKAYFGMKEGQTLKEFGAEMKALSHADKMDIREGLQVALGCEIEEPIKLESVPA